MSPGIIRFVTYTTIGVGTFLFDLGMLYAAVTYGGVPYYVATPAAFLIAVSCNYAISRAVVFKGTERTWRGGYVYFIVVAGAGAGATTMLVTFLVARFGMFFILARVITAGIVGTGNYLFNLHLNFKVAGKH